MKNLSKPKIAYIWPDCSVTNGAGRYIYEISTRLTHKFDVHILATNWDTDFGSEITVNKIPLYFRIPSYLGVFEFVLKSAWLAKKNNYDLILGQGLPLSGLFDQDIIFVHINSPDYVNWKRHSQWRGFNKQLKRIIYSIHPIMLTNAHLRYREGNFKKIIVASNVAKKELIFCYGVLPNKIEVIPLGVRIEEFHPKKKYIYGNEIRKKYDISSDEYVLFFCGQDFERKGLAFVLKAMHFVKNDNIKLIVAGKGENDRMSNVRKMVVNLGLEEKVIFVGSTNRVDLYYAASDAFVLPTLYDPFGLVLLEAMASGIPVIVSRKAGASELIQDGIGGFILKHPTDYEELSTKIRILATNRTLSKSMGSQARAIAEKYSWDIVADSTSQLYSEIIREKYKAVHR
jgi:UDP-glucose:(heptosyl)LPS alpha-1,3-glucosyltransferase